VLVVDDNVAIHEDFRRVLVPDEPSDGTLHELSAKLFGRDAEGKPEARVYELASAQQGEAALDLVRIATHEERPFSIAFVDMRMPPGWNGAETTQQLWRVDPHLQVVICTAYSDFRWADVMSFLGATDNLSLLRKPFKPEDVRRMADVLGTKCARLRR
jgi:CheY-like chemotaxis protein